jgi:DNA excision repair protein ERCC-3
MAPSERFRENMMMLRTRAKLGLTATLLREDDAIIDLDFLVGPKLIDVQWQTLAREGYIATVSCQEIVCPMAERFAQAYFDSSPYAVAYHARILYEINPNKVEMARLLMTHHEQAGDKILIFADRLEVIDIMASKFNREHIVGSTDEEKREELFERFRKDPREPGAISTLILSKVGEIAIDLPCANIVIQVCQMGVSRRQETQRMGRILRPKKGDTARRALFYALVTQDSPEQRDAEGRRSHLVNEGYGYRRLDWMRTLDSLGAKVIPENGTDIMPLLDQKRILERLGAIRDCARVRT